jgi:hypothetical protein
LLLRCVLESSANSQPVLSQLTQTQQAAAGQTALLSRNRQQRSPELLLKLQQLLLRVLP